VCASANDNEIINCVSDIDFTAALETMSSFVLKRNYYHFKENTADGCPFISKDGGDSQLIN
jgi:hypothetical protein